MLGLASPPPRSVCCVSVCVTVLLYRMSVFGMCLMRFRFPLLSPCLLLCPLIYPRLPLSPLPLSVLVVSCLPSYSLSHPCFPLSTLVSHHHTDLVYSLFVFHVPLFSLPFTYILPSVYYFFFSSVIPFFSSPIHSPS